MTSEEQKFQIQEGQRKLAEIDARRAEELRRERLKSFGAPAVQPRTFTPAPISTPVPPIPPVSQPTAPPKVATAEPRKTERPLEGITPPKNEKQSFKSKVSATRKWLDDKGIFSVTTGKDVKPVLSIEWDGGKVPKRVRLHAAEAGKGLITALEEIEKINEASRKIKISTPNISLPGPMGLTGKPVTVKAEWKPFKRLETTSKAIEDSIRTNENVWGVTIPVDVVPGQLSSKGAVVKPIGATATVVGLFLPRGAADVALIYLPIGKVAVGVGKAGKYTIKGVAKTSAEAKKIAQEAKPLLEKALKSSPEAQRGYVGTGTRRTVSETDTAVKEPPAKEAPKETPKETPKKDPPKKEADKKKDPPKKDPPRDRKENSDFLESLIALKKKHLEEISRRDRQLARDISKARLDTVKKRKMAQRKENEKAASLAKKQILAARLKLARVKAAERRARADAAASQAAPEPRTEPVVRRVESPQPEPQPAPQTRLQPATQTQTETKPQTKPEPQPKPEPQSKPDAQTKTSPETKPEPQPKPFPQTQTQTQTETSPDAITEPRTELRPEPDGTTQAGVQTVIKPTETPKPEEKEKPQEKNEVSPKPTDTGTGITELPRQRLTPPKKTPRIPPKTPPKKPPKKPPKRPPIRLPKAPDVVEIEGRRIRRFGAVAWRQGIVWIVIYPPYEEDNVIYTRKRPKWIKIISGPRSAYRTIAQLGNVVPRETRIKIGAFTATVTGGPKRPTLSFDRRVKNPRLKEVRI